MIAGRLLLIVGLGFGLGCQGPEPHEASSDPPNVLIVMIDALRADRLGVNGYPRPTTPSIDQLASEGVNFTRAFAHSTWTKPSIATLFTSVYPSQHGLDQVATVEREGMGSEVLGSHLTTVAESFQAAGYRTGAIVNQVHITPRFGFDQGFDTYQARRGTAAPRLNRRLLAWLETEDPANRPFFAYLHYLDVHWPYNKLARDRSEDLGSLELTHEPPKKGKQSVEDWVEELELPMDLDALQSRYDHEVAYTDQALGALMTELERLDLFEETIVVVTADHGEAFLEHGNLLHGHPPHEELIRIPLVFRLPARLRKSVGSVESPVGLIDLMPTLLDLAGLEPVPGAQGRSFAPLLRGEDLRDRLVFIETETAIAVRSGERKTIRFADGRLQHFDLVEDPHEQQPGSGSCGEPCAVLERRLADFTAAMAAARQSVSTEVVPLEDQDLEEMRALGYLD